MNTYNDYWVNNYISHGGKWGYTNGVPNGKRKAVKKYKNSVGNYYKNGVGNYYKNGVGNYYKNGVGNYFKNGVGNYYKNGVGKYLKYGVGKDMNSVGKYLKKALVGDAVKKRSSFETALDVQNKNANRSLRRITSNQKAVDKLRYPNKKKK